MSSIRNHGINLLIAGVIALVTYGLWAFANRPSSEPPWPERIAGFSFAPFHEGQSPIKKKFPTVEQIDADLALLQGKVHAVRTYTVEGTLAEIPRLARSHNMNVFLGGWIGRDAEANVAEMERLIQVADRNRRNVVRVAVGNESILRGDILVKDLAAHLDYVRSKLKVPVSTAEPWHVWIKYPELAKHVDFLAIHMLPYWEGIPLDGTLDFFEYVLDKLKTAYPDKPIVFGEVGWPSNGRSRGAAEASTSNQASFLRRFINWAEQKGHIYYIMEAFDQPWKMGDEGSVGAYWGVFDLQRNAKFAFTSPIVKIPEWPVLAAICTALAFAVFFMLLVDGRTLRNLGRLFLAVTAFSAVTVVVWVGYEYFNQYLNLTSFIVGALLIVAMLGILVVFLVEAHEWAEAKWIGSWRRQFPHLVLDDKDLPKVSVHVAAYNEPPDMLKQTLAALERLDYPNYEVVVVDNNTKDPAVWKPVEAYCESLGPRFRFFHVDPLEGFKAGALNFALKHTADDSEIIAVIDADYIVRADWLRKLVPHFQRDKVAIVQAPQDYRDGNERLFKSMCYSEYKGFFHIGMMTRNERNAIIQHGTMTMVRRRTLEEVGAWGQWTITEDADLGLRIFAEGYEAVYTPESYGQGLMPDTFIDYKKQRHRWAFGAMQILRHYRRELLGQAPSQLSAGQRYHFVAGWLPWIADGFAVLFTLGALLWSAAMLWVPDRLDPPMVAFTALPVSLFLFKIIKLVYLYCTRVQEGCARTFTAAISGLALSHTIGLAILQGLVRKDMAFYRTPKMKDRSGLFQAWLAAREEFLLMTALWAAAAALSSIDVQAEWDMRFWIAALLIQSLPYLAAVIMALVSAMPGKARQESLAGLPVIQD